MRNKKEEEEAGLKRKKKGSLGKYMYRYRICRKGRAAFIKIKYYYY